MKKRRRIIVAGLILVPLLLLSACALREIVGKILPIGKKTSEVTVEKPEYTEPAPSSRQGSVIQRAADRVIEWRLTSLEKKNSDLQSQLDGINLAAAYQQKLNNDILNQVKAGQEMRDTAYGMILIAYAKYNNKNPDSVEDLKAFARDVLNLDYRMGLVSDAPEEKSPPTVKTSKIKEILSKIRRK